MPPSRRINPFAYPTVKRFVLKSHIITLQRIRGLALVSPFSKDGYNVLMELQLKSEQCPSLVSSVRIHLASKEYGYYKYLTIKENLIKNIGKYDIMR
jgi:hypothetical protein